MEMKYSKNVSAIYHLKKVIATSIPHGSREEFPGGMPPDKPIAVIREALLTQLKRPIDEGVVMSASGYVKELEAAIVIALSQSIQEGKNNVIHHACINFVAQAAKWEVLNQWIAGDSDGIAVQDLHTVQELGFPKKLVDDFCEQRMGLIPESKRSDVRDQLEALHEAPWTAYFTNHPNKAASDKADLELSGMIAKTVAMFSSLGDSAKLMAEVRKAVPEFSSSIDGLIDSGELMLSKLAGDSNEEAMIKRNEERLETLVEPFMRAAMSSEKPTIFGHWFAADQDGNRYSDGAVFAETVTLQVQAYQKAYQKILGEIGEPGVSEKLSALNEFLSQDIDVLMSNKNLNVEFLDLVQKTETALEGGGATVKHAKNALRVMGANRLTNGQMLRQDGGVFVRIFEDYGDQLVVDLGLGGVYDKRSGSDNTSFFDELYVKLEAPDIKSQFLAKIKECLETQSGMVKDLEGVYLGIPEGSKKDERAKNMAFTDLCEARAVYCTLSTFSEMADLPNAGGLSHMIQSNSGDTAGVDQEYLAALPFIKALGLEQDPSFRFSLLNERGESVVRECPDGFEKLRESVAFKAFLNAPAGIKSLVFGPSDNSRVKGTWSAYAYLREGSSTHHKMGDAFEAKAGIGNAAGRLIGELNVAETMMFLGIGSVVKSQTCQGVEATEYANPETAASKLARVDRVKILAAMLEMTDAKEAGDLKRDEKIRNCFKAQSDPYRALLSGWPGGKDYSDISQVIDSIGASVPNDQIVQGLSKELFLQLLEEPSSWVKAGIAEAVVDKLRIEALTLQAKAKEECDALKAPFASIGKLAKAGSIRPASRPAPLDNMGYPSIWESRAIGTARDQWALALPFNMLIGFPEIVAELKETDGCYGQFCELLKDSPENRDNPESLRFKTLFNQTQEAALHYELMWNGKEVEAGSFEEKVRIQFDAAVAVLKEVNLEAFREEELFAGKSTHERDLINQKAAGVTGLRKRISSGAESERQIAARAYLMADPAHCG